MNNETKRTKISVQDMVQLSVLIAILLLLELTGLGMIKTAGLEITIMLVPVIVGAIVMGPAAGALLGGVFGLYELLPAFLVSLAVCAVVSLVTPAPTEDILAEFDAAK